jgi:Family of unknown function (DUF6328)
MAAEQADERAGEGASGSVTTRDAGYPRRCGPGLSGTGHHRMHPNQQSPDRDDHDEWNAQARGETPLQRADRAYNEVLQEVRVAQTGVQILFAFLLALAFTNRFPTVTTFERDLYVVTLMLCAAATALLIAPAAFHRVIYRQRLKPHLVRVASRLALAGLGFLLLALVSALLLILDVTLSLVPALILAGAAFAFFATWWFALPLRLYLRHQASLRDLR